MYKPHRVAVCIAVYNGEKFLKRQLDTILDQLTADDQVIIIDDCSNDGSLAILSSYEDNRILLHQNLFNMGHVKVFESAISMANSNYIFLADQDDIWVPGRVQFMIDALDASGKDIIFTNFDLIDQSENFIGSSLLIFSNNYYSVFANILSFFLGRRIPYWGCAAMFRSTARNYILPFPTYIEAHDLWIALSGIINSSIITVDKVTLLRRIHDANVTPNKNRSFYLKIKTRLILFNCLIVAVFNRMFRIP